MKIHLLKFAQWPWNLFNNLKVVDLFKFLAVGVPQLLMRFCHETSCCLNSRPESRPWFWEHNYLWLWKCHQGSQYEQHDTPPIFFGRYNIFIFPMWFIFHLLYFDVIWLLLQNSQSLSSADPRILDLGLFHLLDLLNL